MTRGAAEVPPGLVLLRGWRYAKWLVGALVILGLPAAGTVYWLYRWVTNGFEPAGLVLLALLYPLGMVGVTVGIHRLFSHKSFRTRRPIELTLAVLAAMSQGAILSWVANHRWHHTHADSADDLHSPHGGFGGKPSWRLFLHAHLLWIFMRRRARVDRYARDWAGVPGIALIDKVAPLWMLLAIGSATLVGHLLSPTAGIGPLSFLAWACLAIFLVQHMTFFINSLCHLTGYRSHETKDRSFNNRFVGLLGFGEGWHNNHHWKPGAAKLGRRRGEMDIGYQVIRLLCWLGLAELRPGGQRRGMAGG